MRILGISAFYHDSAAALVEDGRDRRGGAGGTLHAQEARCRVSLACASPTASARRGIRADRARSRRVLRQAVSEVRAAARNLSRLCAAGISIVPHGDAAVAEGKAVPEAAAGREARRNRRRRRLGVEAVLCRAPSEPRGVGVLSLAVRGGRGPHARRCRRMGDDRRPASVTATGST